MRVDPFVELAVCALLGLGLLVLVMDAFLESNGAEKLGSRSPLKSEEMGGGAYLSICSLDKLTVELSKPEPGFLFALEVDFFFCLETAE
eukprot:CAMPEP_0170502386 /NCGR_PEP_ID=MMETSP0208-20121228/41328_1 /TAXON_ID=197538 /ORGANISM="Strombidium inclinatum, Strain S3" /LENGTH=88 /DNA_ID=CAMNT_0010781433 /DNA_START=627 /DNA_END=894 /DNA_ORIENTATION=-